MRKKIDLDINEYWLASLKKGTKTATIATLRNELHGVAKLKLARKRYINRYISNGAVIADSALFININGDYDYAMNLLKNCSDITVLYYGRKNEYIDFLLADSSNRSSLFIVGNALNQYLNSVLVTMHHGLISISDK